MKTFWTDAVQSGNTYNFTDGTAVENGGALLEAASNRPYVVFARKGFVYQRKEVDRKFKVLCRKGRTENCVGKSLQYLLKARFN